MAPFSSVIVLLLAVSHAYGFADQVLTLGESPAVATVSKEIISNETKESKQCRAEFSCVGCSDILLCKTTKSGYKKVMTLTCRNPTPYCDDATASCISHPPLPCAPSDNFTCTNDGVFPDTVNCSVYHFCKNSTSFAYSCPKGRYYDATREECVATACNTFDCKGKHGLKSFHRGNKNIFAYCSDSTPVLISKCETGYELNEATQRCELQCRSEGHFMDIEDCTKYYICGLRNVLTSHSCPLSYGFDPVDLRCVPLAMLPSCKY